MCVLIQRNVRARHFRRRQSAVVVQHAGSASPVVSIYPLTERDMYIIVGCLINFTACQYVFMLTCLYYET